MSFSGYVPSGFYGTDRKRAVIASDFHIWEADKYNGGSSEQFIEYIADALNDASDHFDVDRFYNLGDTGDWDIVRDLSNALKYDEIEHLEGDEDRFKRTGGSYRGWAAENRHGHHEQADTEFRLSPELTTLNIFPRYDINLQHFPKCVGNETRNCVFNIDPNHDQISYFFDDSKDVSPTLEEPSVNFHGHSHVDSTRRIWNSVVNSVGGFRNPYNMSKYDERGLFKIASFGREEVDILTVNGPQREIIGSSSYELRPHGSMDYQKVGSDEEIVIEDETVVLPANREFMPGSEGFVQTEAWGKDTESHKDFIDPSKIPESFGHPLYDQVREEVTRNV